MIVSSSYFSGINLSDFGNTTPFLIAGSIAAAESKNESDVLGYYFYKGLNLSDFGNEATFPNILVGSWKFYWVIPNYVWAYFIYRLREVDVFLAYFSVVSNDESS